MSIRLCLPRRIRHSSINDAFRRGRPSELYELFRESEGITFKPQFYEKVDLGAMSQAFLSESEVAPALSRSPEEVQALKNLNEMDIFTQSNWGVLLEDCSQDQYRLLQREELKSELTDRFSLTPQDLDNLPNHLSDDLRVVKDLKVKSGFLQAGSEVFRIGQHIVKTKEDLKKHAEDSIEFRTIGGAIREQLYGKSALPIPIVPKKHTAMTNDRRQFLIERKGFADSVKEFRDVQDSITRLGLLADMERPRSVWIRWAEQMVPKIREAQENGKIPHFLCPDVLSVVTCKATLNTMFTPKNRAQEDKVETSLETWKKMELGEVDCQVASKVATLCTAVGDAVNFEWNCKTLEDKIKNKDASLSDELVKNYRDAKKNSDRKRMLGLLSVFHNQSWNEFEVRVPMGAELLKILIDTAKVEADFHDAKSELSEEHQSLQKAHAAKLRRAGKPVEELPSAPDYALLKSDSDPSKVLVRAFYHRLVYSNKKMYGQVAMRKVALKSLRGDWDDLARAARPAMQPMMRKPLPWMGVRSGSFLVNSVKFVRHQGIKTIDFDFESYDHSRITKVMDFLGSVPWRINKKNVDWIEHVRKHDLRIAGIPRADDEAVPAKPDSEALLELSTEERQKLKMELLNAVRANEKLQSARPTLQLKMQVAHNYYNADRFYFPHNVDYRGRSYPLPPHLNHQGDDVCRGILMFADGKPLGKEGLRWLKISLANLYGKDKLTFQGREEWTEENMPLIRKAAKNPFDPEIQDWWTAAGDGPWQFLARCVEITDAMDSGDPEAFVSHQPVHMDGSCNGLQHYAALGRDEWGAKSVNLLPGDTVQDVYVEVLNVVKKKVEKDSATAIKGPNLKGQRCNGELSRLALKLQVLERKTVKQTVMTICYGVTSLGAKDQVRARLIEKVGTEVDPAVLNDLARYLSKVVLDSIGTIFKQAMQLKVWFDNVSKVFNKTGTTVCWMSPLGFAVRQPYYEHATKSVQTALQKINLTKKNASDKIKKASQRSGFPPNFVHSLDAAHLMLAAERCEAEGIAFVGVHDSFWTHACDVTRLNEIIRETFIELHHRPILQDLDQDFRTRLGPHADMLHPLPAQGKLELEQVLESQYFFD
eukprot:GEMP01008137.1.p1 GENE.GEMP01008137.1~~GEMP01008137.1.p1  ORF type:complete len:1103 (+),score=219.97 GEMP01008137.1:115-3423(+)